MLAMKDFASKEALAIDALLPVREDIESIESVAVQEWRADGAKWTPQNHKP
jgi:hypothetical protein